MLSVEGILALDHTGVPAAVLCLGRVHQSGQHFKIGYSRELDGRVFPTGSLHTDGTGGDYHIVAFHIQFNAAAGAYTHKGVRADLNQLLHGNHGRGPADAGGAHRHLLPQQGSGPDIVLTVGHHMDRIIKISRDFFTASRISGQQAVSAHIAVYALNMILTFLLDHGNHPSVLFFNYIPFPAFAQAASAACRGT